MNLKLIQVVRSHTLFPGNDKEGYFRPCDSQLNKELKPQMKSSPDGVNPGPLPHIFISE
jgi:hypothetical protein